MCLNVCIQLNLGFSSSYYHLGLQDYVCLSMAAADSGVSVVAEVHSGAQSAWLHRDSFCGTAFDLAWLWPAASCSGQIGELVL